MMITLQLNILILTFSIMLLSSLIGNVGSSYYKFYSKSSSRWISRSYSDKEDVRNVTNNKQCENNGEPSALKESQSSQSLKMPSPELSTPEECARHCEAGTEPKNCYYHWTFEYYHTLGGACELCQSTTNTSISSDCQCILADGVDMSGIIVANRMYPGPSVQVCLGDLVVVDATNMVPGNGITIHFHGIYQKNYQHYDGVPYVTQCPIAEATTFRYQWRAQNIGSHFWHAHTGLHKADGLEGAIVIRQPPEDEVHHKYYDVDGFDGTIFLTDWLHNSAADHFPGNSVRNLGQDPDNFLINGKGQWTDPVTANSTSTPLAVINIKQGLRYRFRIINAFTLGCPAYLTIQSHNLTIISVDGENVVPQPVTTVTTFSAERVDVVLNANQSIGTYWIQLRGAGTCAQNGLQQYAILRYENSDLATPNIPKPLYSPGLPRGIIFNEVNQVCDGTHNDVICVKDLQSFDPINERIFNGSSDIQVFLSFAFYTYDDADLFRPNTYQRFVVPFANLSVASAICGISNTNTPSPLISQFDDIPKDHICNSTNLPARCANTSVCQCTHMIHLPLDAVVDIILVDGGIGGPNGISHPFHLHGYGFHVISQGLLSKVNLTEANKKDAVELDRKGYPRSQIRPPTKDTLAIASGGYTIVRFIADNPGWWLYHCHFLPHLYNGMSLVFHVGEPEDLPSTPTNFPSCGNFAPEIYQSDPKPL